MGSDCRRRRDAQRQSLREEGRTDAGQHIAHAADAQRFGELVGADPLAGRERELLVVRGGTVVGASDSIGAYPVSDPQKPENLAATIYEALGLPRPWDQQWSLRLQQILFHREPEFPLEAIAAPLDYLGVNYYTRAHYAFDPDAAWPHAVARPGPLPKTQMGWEIYPEGLHGFLTRMARDYVGELGVHVEACSNEASAAAMLGASIHYPLRGAVTWKSIVGTNVASDALSNLSSAGVIGEMLADKMRHDDAYERAMNEWLQRKTPLFHTEGDYPTRDEIYAERLDRFR